jgi:2,3,4,5-tetrahydropyridine-2,6-dicarboxylate N-succinyltransferase
MPRDITITFSDGTKHQYNNTPDSVTPDDIEKRAKKDYPTKKISNISGGKKKPVGDPLSADPISANARPKGSVGSDTPAKTPSPALTALPATLPPITKNDELDQVKKNAGVQSKSEKESKAIYKSFTEDDFKKSGFRALPGSVVRRGSYIGKNVVLMPSFVNIGAYVGDSTMVDTWSTIGSCAQIGKNCHISGGVGIGGVLEPLQGNPVIIEDDCFIGARSEIAEGVIVEKGSVISMGVYIGASTKIIDRSTGEIFMGRVPAYSVVVSGTMASENNKDKNLSLYCAVIVKKVDEKTRSKTSINELLRD